MEARVADVPASSNAVVMQLAWKVQADINDTEIQH